MLKDISALKVAGANFSNDTVLDFFNPTVGNQEKAIKASLVYGKNGTGKTTIARAFRKLSGKEDFHITNASFLDASGHAINITEDEKKEIFVFDEDYVRDKVLLQEDHLGTIVMLGQAANLTKKIREAEAEKKEAENAFNQQKKICQDYEDIKNVSSPKYYSMQLRQALQGDNNWAGRDREIHNHRKNATVKEDTYKQFVNLFPSKSKMDLLNQYKEKVDELSAAKSGASIIDSKVPIVPNELITYDDGAVQKLLSEKIESPELTEREKKLLSIVQMGGADDLATRLKVFSDTKTKECPYCYQILTNDYKGTLVKEIEKVLSKEVKNHRENLQRKSVDLVALDLSLYEKLDYYQLCVDLIEKINSMLRENNEHLRLKGDNPYQPIETEISSIKELANKLSEAFVELEKERLTFNKMNNTEMLVEELDKINAEIAHYEIVDIASQFEKQQTKYEKNKNLCVKLEQDFKEKELAVQDLEAQRNSIKLAVDVMNACMKYIFFADDRLTIECNNGVYKLLSHGNSVRPSEVSVGERNIIGLCYFFTSILEGQEESKAYEKEYLLVIDDPVSSYDTENRVGILSFLKYKLGVLLEGNINTKALVMTHDLMTFFDLYKALEEIIAECKQKESSEDFVFKALELIENGTLHLFLYKNRQEYTEMVKIIYNYAREKDQSEDSVIGNVMRQVLEAFSTFVYKKSIEKISTDTQILTLLERPEYISYFKNLMYRLVLHGGSHKEEQIKSMADLQFFNYVSKTEKIRTAKDVLCFIYLLNKTHLLEHLKDYSTAESDLNSWCQDIMARSVII